MRAFQVPGAGQPFQAVERDVSEPGPGLVRLRVEACGVCHSDVLTKEGLFPGIAYPRVPGHEIAGTVDAIGSDVPAWNRATAPASAGTAATADTATPAGEATT